MTTSGHAGASLDLLILGGTGFIGTHQVSYALAGGHRVTPFNRGQRDIERIAGVEYLVGDRDGGDYAALRGRRFDACIDNATLVPRWVREAAHVLSGNVGHYTFISTVSVYASDAEPDADETAARARRRMPAMLTRSRFRRRTCAPTWHSTGRSSAGEDEGRCAAIRGHCALLRPGLIVGPGDESDRFAHWPVRVARGGTVLVPPRLDPVQWIDVRDVAEWSDAGRRAALDRRFQSERAGAATTMGDMLGPDLCRGQSSAVLRGIT